VSCFLCSVGSWISVAVEEREEKTLGADERNGEQAPTNGKRRRGRRR